MRVVVLPSWYPAYLGDTNGIFFREQAQGMASAGVDVTVIAPQRKSWSRLLADDQPLPSISGLTERLGPYRSAPPPFPGDRSAWTRQARRLYAAYIEKRGAPDILHAHSLYRAGPFMQSAEARAKILTEHASAFMGPTAQGFADLARPWVPVFDRRIAVGLELAERLGGFFPDAGRWDYVPNSVDTNFFEPTSQVQGLAPARIFTAGYLTPRKRVDLLISAFDRAFADSDATLIIAGSGPEEKALRELARTKRSGDRISFLGHARREVIRDEMQKCTLFALASRHETFGVVLIEALACGKPVVATDSGGPSTIITDSRLGILIKADDENALVDALSRAASEPTLWDAAYIRAHAVSKFGQRKVTADLIALYEECLKHAS
jgi:L-malate glycosyltransferase